MAKAKIELVTAGDLYAVKRTDKFLFFTRVSFYDLVAMGYKWSPSSEFFKDCWGTYDRAKIILAIAKCIEGIE